MEARLESRYLLLFFIFKFVHYNFAKTQYMLIDLDYHRAKESKHATITYENIKNLQENNNIAYFDSKYISLAKT